MIPDHDHVRLTGWEHAEIEAMERGLASRPRSPAPTTLLVTGLVALVAGSVAVSPAVLFAGIGLALAGLARAARAGPRA